MSKLIDDLFRGHTTLERIPMPDAEVYYLRELILAQTAEAVMNQLIDEVPWRAPKTSLSGEKLFPNLV